MGLEYNRNAKRWEIRERGKMLAGFPVGMKAISGILSFNVTNATVTVPSAGAAICTLPVLTGLKQNAHIVVNPRTNMSINIAAARTIADNYAQLDFVNPHADESVIVKGTSLDVLVINTE